MKDTRHQSYITYEGHVNLFTRILGSIFHIGSMRKISTEFNHDACIKNVGQMLAVEDLQELPHWSTINNYLEKVDPVELEEIIQKLVYRLIRMRSFEGSRLRNKYWQILIDGTGLCSFNERHCPNCLTKEHKDKDGNISWTEYNHSVLEAKLVLNGNIVVSIATEFIENEKPNAPKQDCELNTFYRMAAKLKQRFPRLPICLGMDSLYACGPVFEICRHNNWRFIIRFKNGSLPSVAEEFHALKTMESKQFFVRTEADITKTYRYVLNIPYQTHQLNVVEYIQSDLEHPFVFITDLLVSTRNCEQLVEDGRRRWKIENEGFNSQKNHGYELEHLFSKNYIAMKNHYFLIQIGHMIAQFFENALDIWKSIRAPDYMIFQIVKKAFQESILTETDILSFDCQRQYRFI